MKKNKILNLFGDKLIVRNQGVKYSELAEKFMANFENALSEMGDIDNILEFSIAAWNFGNLSLIIGKEEFKKIIAHASDENINIKLLHEMIYYKATNFEKHKSFIVDYELEERNGEQILSIITQEEDAYLASMLNH